jgi:hypothetical protein
MSGASETGLLPHLSFSRVDRYLECPEQYRLYYLEGLRPRIPSASLMFGQTIHQALAFFFATKDHPIEFFEKIWGDLEKSELRYGARDFWEKLRSTGRTLLERFVQDEVPRLGRVIGSEQSFELAISNLEMPFIGIIDLVADREGKRTVIDFKTSSSAYQDHEVAMSDQLTAYRLAVPEAEDAALCVFVKTKEPRIDWYTAQRSGEQLTEFLRKAAYVAQEITSGHLYKRPGTWCSWCDFLPICLGNKEKAQESLIRVS